MLYKKYNTSSTATDTHADRNVRVKEANGYRVHYYSGALHMHSTE